MGALLKITMLARGKALGHLITCGLRMIVPISQIGRMWAFALGNNLGSLMIIILILVKTLWRMLEAVLFWELMINVYL
jgi:hypothetical protein